MTRLEGVVIRRGCLHWVRLDKRRPALIVSPDYRNERASDVIVVPSSTVTRAAPTHVLLRRGEGGVASRSMLKCEQITTLHKSDVEPAALGRPLSPRRMAEVERAIMKAIGLPVADLD